MTSRRQILKDVLPGAIVAVVGFQAIGQSIAPRAANAMPSDVTVVRPHVTCAVVTVVEVAGGRGDTAGGIGGIASAAGASATDALGRLRARQGRGGYFPSAAIVQSKPISTRFRREAGISIIVSCSGSKT